MALDFPSSPTVGQLYPNPAVAGVPQYTWDGEKWASGNVASIATSKKNYILNGAMMVSQENGATAGAASGYYPVDQFSLQINASGTPLVSQVASSSPVGSPNRLRVTVSVADTTVSAGDFMYILQKVEGLRTADLKFGAASAKAVTVQFGCKAPAGTYCVAINNGAASRSYVAEVVISLGEANTDVVKSVTIPGDVTGTWATDNTAGFWVSWFLVGGSSLQTAPNVWIGTAGYFCTPNQSNFMGTNGNVFELFDVGLYEGNVPPPFVVPDYASELAVCQRYYQHFGGTQNNFGIQGYAGASGINVSSAIPCPVIMRAAPTVTLPTQSGNTNTSGLVANNPNSNGFLLIAPSTAAGQVSALNAANSYCVLNARL